MILEYYSIASGRLLNNYRHDTNNDVINNNHDIYNINKIYNSKIITSELSEYEKK